MAAWAFIPGGTGSIPVRGASSWACRRSLLAFPGLRPSRLRVADVAARKGWWRRLPSYSLASSDYRIGRLVLNQEVEGSTPSRGTGLQEFISIANTTFREGVEMKSIRMASGEGGSIPPGPRAAGQSAC